MRRKRLLILSLLLLVILLPAGGYFYFKPVRVEDLNRQEWCMCGEPVVKFEKGSITLVSSPHPERDKPGSVMGTYRLENGRMIVTHHQFGGEYALDYLGAHWLPPPDTPPALGRDLFFDGHSWRRFLRYGWNNPWEFLSENYRPLIAPALGLVLLSVLLLRSRNRKRQPP